MFLIAFLCSVSALRIHKNFFIQDLERSVDLTTALVKSTSKITFRNDGIIPVEKVYHIVHNSLVDRLFSVVVEQEGKLIKGITIEDEDLQLKYNSTLIEFELNTPISKMDTIELIEHYYKLYTPLPKSIGIEDDQLVKTTHSIYFYTPYLITKQVTYFETNKIVSYSQKSATVRGNVLQYGPYEEIKPYSVQLTHLHLENNSPMVLFKKVIRTVEVSHWGNIHIEEEYSLVNEGATLNGEFGRVVFNKYNPAAGKHALKQMNSQLPYDCWGVYYKDEIGNISTSNAVKGKLNGEAQAQVILKPRFSIFGGWNSNFTLGYNLGTKKYLEHNGKSFKLSLNYIYSVKDIVAEEYILKVILPEGVENVQHTIPVDVETSQQATFSYLDISGRPTYIFKKQLSSQQDNEQFKITYEFAEIQILREPLMILGAFLCMFFGIIILNRLDLGTLKLKSN